MFVSNFPQFIHHFPIILHRISPGTLFFTIQWHCRALEKTLPGGVHEGDGSAGQGGHAM